MCRNIVACLMPIMCLAAAALAHADQPALRWVRRLDEAKKIAVAEQKDLLINFTGVEWCGWCIVLERTVLSKPEFAAAADNFVLVDIDLPSDRSDLGDLQPLYEKWQAEYFIQGFPTVVLADATGRPYAYTGYEEELTPARFLAELHKHQQARERRDRELAAARELVGVDRAEKLHVAMQAVAASLTEKEGVEDDPLLTWYADEVAEIRRLDADNALGLRQVYDDLTMARENLRQRKEMFAKLAHFTSQGDYRAAHLFLDEALTNVADPATRWQVNQVLVGMLQADDKWAPALEKVELLLKETRDDVEHCDWLHHQQAYCLVHLDRLDDAIRVYDEQIAAAKDRPAARLSFMDWKANHLLSTDRHDECIKAYREFRAATTPHSYKWQEATGLMAMACKRAGRPREAIGLYEELLACYRQQGSTAEAAGTLLSIASLRHELGEDAVARQLLDEAEKQVPTAAGKSSRQRDIDELRERLAVLRKSIGQD